jgi:hydrogenase maturation factor
MSSVILLVMFVFQVCFCDIDEEEGSRTLTILQKTFGNDRVMLVFQVCFCDIDEEEGSRTLTILQKTFGNDRVMLVFQV